MATNMEQLREQASDGTLSTNAILGKLASKEINQEQAASLISLATSAEVSAAREQGKREARSAKLYCKVSVRGAVSLYGINSQFPATYYVEPWDKVLTMGLPEDVAAGVRKSHAVLTFAAQNAKRIKEQQEVWAAFELTLVGLTKERKAEKIAEFTKAYKDAVA